MKILVIDNGTSYLNQLKNLLSDTSLEVINYSEINQANSENFDAIILSGGHDFPVSGNGYRLEKEINLITDSKKPIFGICFGFELIASIFGAKLELMENKEHGILDIQVIEPDKIFLKIPNFQVFESHRWVIKKPAHDLIALAQSKDGIEAIKHRIHPIYAVQFHPEMFTDKTCGDEIFRNFLNLVK